MDILTVKGVKKSFGSKKVLDGVDFSVSENCVFGFIGRNGAGKTTTMRAILGLLEIDEGEIKVCDEKVRYGATLRSGYIGFLPDVPEFYGYMKASEYLTLCGELTGIKGVKLKTRIDELLELVGLDNEKHRINGFSRGMKQRLGIASALIHKPKLLICDEPTSALDPVGRKDILDIIKSSKNETSVVFSTHILSDVEKVCDHVAFLEGGKIAFAGSIEEVHNLKKDSALELILSIGEDVNRVLKAFPKGIYDGSKISFEKASDEMVLRLMGFLSEEKIPVVSLERREINLEDFYMEVIGK